METKPKILMVDDRPENLVALETVLRDLDIEMVKAASGNEALRLTMHHHFALALLDIQMPGMDGYELASILREEEKTSHLPFIFISAVYTDNFNIFKGYETGAFSFITKPFQPEILVNKVKFFVEKHQQEIALHRLNEELAQNNRYLQNMNEELEAFTYTASHDLRSPLRAIKGYASILKEDFGLQLGAECKTLIEGIGNNAVKMETLINSLLALSRSSKQEMAREIVQMNHVVNDVLDELQEGPGRGIIRWTISQLPGVMGDYVLLRQVVFNLISNAIKYSSRKEAPEISIGHKKTDGEVVFMIRDNGSGFNMKYIHKLFKVFERLHNSDEFQGSGVGLAIAKRIIMRHGGRIWAEGEEGKGAVFYFGLPEG